MQFKSKRSDQFTCFVKYIQLIWKWSWSNGRVQLKCDGTRWRTGGEVKGKLVNGVGSQYSSTLYATSELCVSTITTADTHTSTASSRLNWRPRRFKWTRPSCLKMKSGFCACAITFQMQSTYIMLFQLSYVYLVSCIYFTSVSSVMIRFALS